MCPEQGTGEGGEGGWAFTGLTQGTLSTQGLRSVAFRVQGWVQGLGFRVQGSGLGLGFLCEEARSRSSLRRSTPHRQDCSSIGCLQCITTTSTGIG